MRVGGKCKFVQLVGLGPAANATATSTWGPAPAQLLGTSVAAGAKGIKAASVGVVLMDAPAISTEQQADIACKVCFIDNVLRALYCCSVHQGHHQITIGALLGGYETTSFKSKGKPLPLETIQILGFDAAAAAKGAEEGTALARAVMLARSVHDGMLP